MKTSWILVALLFVPFWASAAPAAPQFVLEFADDTALVTVTDPAGKALEVTEGMTLVPGTTITTKATTVEFRLVPNGSVLKLARDTAFRVRTLQGLAGAPSNDFSVLSGKIRMVAAKVAGAAPTYNILTPTTQAGVRGTDFAVEANADTGDWICVKEGRVEFALLKSDGTKGTAIQVGAGEFANAKMAKFSPKKATAADLADKFEGLDFHGAR